jgi:hypothetical protein
MVRSRTVLTEMRVRASLGLSIALLLAACSAAAAPATPFVPPTPAPTVTPWPEGWDTLACDVIAQFTPTSDHLGQITDAADAFDLDTLATETKAMAADMKTANADLAALPTWAPAASFVKHLTAAVLHLRKGANLLQLGIKDIDPDTVNAGVAELDKATPEIGYATKTGGALADKYGFGC